MIGEFTAAEIAVIFAVYLGAATGKGITGLGFSTTCLPFLALTVGIEDALGLIIIPSVSANIIVQVSVGHFGVTLRRFWPMLLATLPGLVLGLAVLDAVDADVAAGALGGVLLLYCAFAFVRRDVRLRPTLERPLAPVSGFLTGLVNGATGSQVMPSMPYLLSLDLPRNVFLQAINCSFTMSSIVMMIGLSRLGLVSGATIVISVVGAVFAFVGLRIGEAIRDRLSEDTFRTAVLAMLTLLAISLIVRAGN